MHSTSISILRWSFFFAVLLVGCKPIPENLDGLVFQGSYGLHLVNQDNQFVGRHDTLCTIEFSDGIATFYGTSLVNGKLVPTMSSYIYNTPNIEFGTWTTTGGTGPFVSGRLLSGSKLELYEIIGEEMYTFTFKKVK